MKKKLLILILLLVTLSGCTKRFTVKDEETSKEKSYVSNILCQPETDKSISIYKNNSEKLLVDFDKLPKCKNMKINSGGYEGLWSSIFVKPLAWLILQIGKFVKNYGIAIMIAGVALRALMIPITKKTTNMNEKMKDAQKDLNALEKKYKGKDDKDSVMQKSQEMMMIYKKHDISPFSSCLFSFLQLPLFFAFLEAVNRVPAFFEGSFWKFNLGQTPMEGFAAGNYWYIILVILIISATYFLFKNMSMGGGDENQAKQMKMMSTFMVIFISFASLSLPTAIALYWIVSNAVTIVQNILTKKGSKNGKI